MTETERLEQTLADMHTQFTAYDPRPNAINSPIHSGMRREFDAVQDALQAQPDYKRRADDDRVELALRDWPVYVACQVKKADRETWATPTSERLAHRLQIGERRVRASLKRRGLVLRCG